MQQTSIILRPALPAWAIFALGAAMVCLTAWAYRRTTRPVTLRLKAALLGMRLVAVAALLLCLLRPALQTTTYTLERRPLVMLLDVSRSMSTIRDTAGGLSRLQAVRKALEENRRAVERLKARYELRTFTFARELLPDTEPSDQQAGYSAYGRALEGALRAVQPAQCEAVVLVGDGSHNLGPPDPMDVAARMAQQGIPLHCVGVGREQPGRQLRDVRIVSLQTPRKAYVFGTFSVRGSVLLRGCRDLEVKVRLEFPGQRMQFHTLRASHDEEIVPVEFQLTPQTLGEFKLTMRAQEQPGEVRLDNNARSAFVQVVSSGLRVGYFDWLRPEGKFILRALEGAEHINITRVLLGGDARALPGSTDWSRYDAVVVGDVPAASFDGEALKALKAAVQERGLGLVLLAGRHSMGPGGFAGTFLEHVLPVRLPRQWAYAGGERRFVVEPAAAGHPIIALGENEAQTLERWSRMGPLSGVVTGATPKQGAEVLARDQEGNPLLCVQRSGAGRTACLLTDTTFRWFFTEADTQQEHQRFWRQLLFWVGGMEQKPRERFRLTLSKREVAVGEPLSIEAHLASATGEPIRDAGVKLTIEKPDGSREELPSLFSRERGCFQAQYSPTLAGEYAVRAEATRGGRHVGADAAFFHASSADRELDDPVANLSLLRRLAAATAQAGGTYRLYTDLSHLLQELEGRGEPLRLTVRRWREVWDGPALFVLFALALVAEWTLRRAKGLL